MTRPREILSLSLARALLQWHRPTTGAARRHDLGELRNKVKRPSAAVARFPAQTCPTSDEEEVRGKRQVSRARARVLLAEPRGGWLPSIPPSPSLLINCNAHDISAVSLTHRVNAGFIFIRGTLRNLRNLSQNESKERSQRPSRGIDLFYLFFFFLVFFCTENFWSASIAWNIRRSRHY